MSCIKFPSSKSELSRAPNKDKINDYLQANVQLTKIANQVFGQDNWSHAITNQTLDFIDYITGKYQAGCVTIVKVQLRDGTFHEGIGYSSMEGSTKGSAIHKSRIKSLNDAFKRALLYFGSEIATKINRLSSLSSSPVPADNAQNLPLPTRKNSITITNKNDAEPLVDIMSQTDAVMDKINLDQLCIKDRKSPTTTTTTMYSKNVNIPKSEQGDSLPANINVDILDDFEAEVQSLCQPKRNIAEPEIENDLDERTKSATKLQKETNTKVPTISTFTVEEMRLIRKRKQKELQNEFKRKEEIKKKLNNLNKGTANTKN